jgi:phospholipid-binding lipoprotein MlaA
MGVTVGGCADLSAEAFSRTADPSVGPAAYQARAEAPLIGLQYASATVSDIADASSDIVASDGYEDANDPLEPFNRFVFAINETLDTFLIRPLAVTYRFWVPEGVRNSVQNFLRNASGPIILMNDLFQGETARAEVTGSRFLINTAIGFGFFDPATGLGLAYHDEDFGQTLASYGTGEGAYLVLPLFGPSSLRDGTGLVVDSIIDPVNYIARKSGDHELIYARGAATGLDKRTRNLDALDDAKRDSLDYYARIRSLWRQIRAREIRNEGASSQDPTLSGLESETAAQPSF